MTATLECPLESRGPERNHTNPALFLHLNRGVLKTKPPLVTHIPAAFIKARGSRSVQAWEGQGFLTHRKAVRRRLTMSWAPKSNEMCLGRCHSKGGP